MSKTITIKTFKQLKELVLNDPSWKGNYSLVIRNLRCEYKLFGEAVCTKMFLVDGEYADCKLDADFEKILKEYLGV